MMTTGAVDDGCNGAVAEGKPIVGKSLKETSQDVMEDCEDVDDCETQKSGYEGESEESDEDDDESDDDDCSSEEDSLPKEILLGESQENSTGKSNDILSSLLNMLGTPKGGKESKRKSIMHGDTFESVEDEEDNRAFDFFIDKTKLTKLFELGKFGNNNIQNVFSHDNGDGDIDKVFDYIEQQRWDKVLELIKSYPEVAVLRMPSTSQPNTDNSPSTEPAYFILEECTSDDMKKEEASKKSDKTEHMGNAVIHEVCRNNAPMDIIDEILDIDCDATKEKCSRGYLPLHYSCYYGASVEVIERLIESYPEAIRCTDSKTNSLPLHLACKTEASPEVIKRLIQEYPEALIVRDATGKTPEDYTDIEGEAALICNEFGDPMLACYEKTRLESEKAAKTKLQKVEVAHKAQISKLVKEHRSIVSNFEDIYNEKDKKIKVMLSLLENNEKTIMEKDELCAKLKEAVTERDSKISSIEKKLGTNEKAYSTHVSRQLSTISDLRGENDELKGKLDTVTSEKNDLMSELKSREDELKKTKLAFDSKTKMIEDLNVTLLQRNEMNEEQAKEIENLLNQISEKDDEIIALQRSLEEKQKAVQLKDATCLKIQEELLEKDENLKNIQGKLVANEKALKENSLFLECKDMVIEAKETMCLKLQSKIRSLEAEVKEVQIQLLEKEEGAPEREEKIAQMESLLEEKDRVIADKEIECENLIETIAAKQAEMDNTQNRLSELEQEVFKQKEDVLAKAKEIEELRVSMNVMATASFQEPSNFEGHELRKMEDLLAIKENIIRQQDAKCLKMEETIRKKEIEVKEVDEKRELHEHAFKALMEKEKSKIDHLEAIVRLLTEENAELKSSWDVTKTKAHSTDQNHQVLSEKNRVIKEKEEECISLGKSMSKIKEKISLLENRIADQDQEIARKDRALEGKDAAMKQKEATCLRLQEAVVTMESEMDTIVDKLKREQQYVAQLENDQYQAREDNIVLARKRKGITKEQSMSNEQRDFQGRQEESSPVTVATEDTKGEGWISPKFSDDNSEVTVPGLVKRLVTRLECKGSDDRQVVTT